MDAIKKYILEQVSGKELDVHKATDYLTMLEINEANYRLCSVAIVGMSVRIHHMRNLEEVWKALIRKQGNKERNCLNENNNFLSCNIYGLSSDRYNNLNIRQKLLLDEIYYALADSGITLAQVKNSNTGVFCRTFPDERRNIEPYSVYKTTHTSFLISGILGTLGPSMDFFDKDGSIYDPLYSALKCLANQECDLAIVGDMDIEELDNHNTQVVDSLKNRSVGGVLILKALKKAQEDTNHIYAVIRGCTKNFNGGFSGVTIPKAGVRAELIKNTLKQAELSYKSIQYLEFVGGDLSEYDDVLVQFLNDSNSKQVYNISSIERGNHLTDCLGILSLFKAILAVYKAMIPPILVSEEWSYSQIYNGNSIRISKTAAEWNGASNIRRGCINYYDHFGSNCSLILESYQENSVERKTYYGQRFFCISAKTEEEMSIFIQNLYNDIKDGNIEFDDLCYTSTIGQNHNEIRYVVLVNNMEELLGYLKKIIEKKCIDGTLDDCFYGLHRRVGAYYHKDLYDIDAISNSKLKDLTEQSQSITEHKRLYDLSLEDRIMLCKLYVSGADIEWEKLYKGMDRRLISFTKYPATMTVTEQINNLCLADLNEDICLMGKMNNEYTVSERIIGGIVAKVLHVNPIYIYDSYVLKEEYEKKESLLLAIINEKLQCNITIHKLRKFSNVYTLAKHIDLMHKRISMRVPDYFDLSNQQMSILISHKLEGNCSYNIPRVLFVEGAVDVNRINEVFYTIISRHDALRTSIQLYQGKYVQKVNKQVDFQIDYEKKLYGEFNVNLLNDFVRPFDLSKAPLLRVKVIELCDKNFAVMLDIHHIIADRQSIIILMREFVQLYQGRSLERISKQYYHYIQWQKEFMKTIAWQKQEEYWLKQYSESPPIINMKTDYERNQFDSLTEETILYQFSDSVIAKIDTFCANNKITVNMLMLAVYYTLLYYWLEMKCLVVGINTNGRNLEGIGHTIGMFVNTLAVQNEVDVDSKFIDFLYRTKKKLILAYANSDYSYEVFIDKLRKVHKDQTISLIKTLFVMQNSDFDVIHLDSLKVKQYDDYIKTDARFDLQINVFHTENRKSNICFIYCKELFKVNTMKKLVNGYISILNQVLDNSDILINELKVDL